MRAAKNFTIGLDPEDFDTPAEARQSFKVGDEIPKKIADQLSDDLILEKVMKDNPNSLSREQLLVLAGIDKEDADSDSEEFDEEQFQEGLKEFKTKQALVDWAKEVVGVELDKDDGDREQLEEWITMAAQGIDPFEDDEDEDDEE